MAVVSFACFGILVFLSALQLGPLGLRASILAGGLLLLLLACFIPTSWFFAGRFLYFRTQLMQHVQASVSERHI